MTVFVQDIDMMQKYYQGDQYDSRSMHEHCQGYCNDCYQGEHCKIVIRIL